MPLIALTGLLATLGIPVLLLAYVVTVTPGGEGALVVLRGAALACIAGFGALTAFLARLRRRNPEHPALRSRVTVAVITAIVTLVGAYLLFAVFVGI